MERLTAQQVWVREVEVLLLVGESGTFYESVESAPDPISKHCCNSVRPHLRLVYGLASGVWNQFLPRFPEG